MRRLYRTGILVVTLFALCVCSGCKEGGEVPEGTTPTSGASDVQTGENRPEGTETPVSGFDTYSEALMLQQAVEARVLPAVERRLPKEADVVIVDKTLTGAYGADVQFATENADTLTGALVSEGLFCYAEDGTIAPNIAKSYTVNSDFTKYTIYLREGLRWSDGVLFTSDDCVFF